MFKKNTKPKSPTVSVIEALFMIASAAGTSAMVRGTVDFGPDLEEVVGPIVEMLKPTEIFSWVIAFGYTLFAIFKVLKRKED